MELIASDAPATVKAVPRLESDIEALITLTKGAGLAVQVCRISEVFAVAYDVMGDASGKAFRSNKFENGQSVAYTGNWSLACQEESSNWKEANNLVCRVEDMQQEGDLKDKEVFIFTDNIVLKGPFTKIIQAQKV